MYQLILASGSPRRKEILEQCGISFRVQKSDKEEIITKSEPAEAVKELSDMKAEDIAAQAAEENCIILGADTIVADGNRILGKPEDEEAAFTMIQSLQGHTHSVFTGVTLLIKAGNNSTKLVFAEETKVEIAAIPAEEIWDYIATGEPMDKAGAYGIQGKFACYVKGIQGDYYNVVGLPISRIMEELKKQKINLKKDCKK